MWCSRFASELFCLGFWLGHAYVVQYNIIISYKMLCIRYKKIHIAFIIIIMHRYLRRNRKTFVVWRYTVRVYSINNVGITYPLLLELMSRVVYTQVPVSSGNAYYKKLDFNDYSVRLFCSLFFPASRYRRATSGFSNAYN